LGLAQYNFSILGKTVENLAPQKQKITPLLLYLYQNRRLHFKKNLQFYHTYISLHPSHRADALKSS